MRTILALLALLLAPAVFAAPADPLPAAEIVKQASIYESRGENRPDGYVIGRSLLSYSAALPAEFLQSLASLGPDNRWLDIGAGEGRAILDYKTSKYDVALPSPNAQGKAKAMAISIEDRRTPQWYQTASAVGDHEIKYLFGRPFRDYPNDELGRFDVITDVFGGFSYTRDIGVYMEKALSILKVSGSIYTVLQDVHWQDGDNKPFYAGSPFLTEIAKQDGSEMKVCAWLKNISCVQVTCEVKDASPPVEMYRVQKVCENVSVPAVVPVHFQAGTPPERKFKLTNGTLSATR